jgi:hypothetical protein
VVLMQCQLGEADPGITSVYLRRIDNTEIIPRHPRAACADDFGHERTRADRPATDPAQDEPVRWRSSAVLLVSLTSARVVPPE